MSWDIKDVVARRQEFVTLAAAGGVSMAALCRRFGISRKTGYKWRARHRVEGAVGLEDRPHSGGSPRQHTPVRVARLVVALRAAQPTWGPRKLRRRLDDLGHKQLPAVSTFARILRRSGCISAEARAAHRPVQRFARTRPNELWQMDFKGHFPLDGTRRCHPLTICDDYSRYAVGLRACADETTLTVRQRLEHIFTVHGLPESILCDNGPPWGGAGPEHTTLTVWLLRLGVLVLHGRPRHPQTQGKIERFHRTLQADLLDRHDWHDLAQAQRRFDAYRQLYNEQRPHEALHLAVPASRYTVSPRTFPRTLPLAEYASDELVRRVKSKGEITFANRFFYVGKAFVGLPLALRPMARDGLFRVCYASFHLGLLDLTLPSSLPRGHYHPLLPLSSPV